MSKTLCLLSAGCSRRSGRPACRVSRRPSPLDSGRDCGRRCRQSGAILSGELASLQAILETGAVRCPRPLGVAVQGDSGCTVLVTEYLHMSSLRSRAAALGEQIAR